MARFAAALALVALLAGTAAAQNLNLNLLKGTGGSLIPPSNVGVFVTQVAQSEFSTVAAKDKTGFLSTFGFTFANSGPTTPGTILTFQNDGNFEFDIPTVGTATGSFSLYVCNSRVRGNGAVIGTFLDATQTPPALVFRQVSTQIWKTRTALYLAAQFIDATGAPTNKFFVKLDTAASQGSALTTRTSQANTLCGFQSI